MRLHQKYILAVLPIMLIGLGSLGGWSYLSSRDALYRSEQEAMGLMLDEAINQIISNRYTLLEKTGLSSIDSFVRTYQEESFADLQALSQRTGRRFFVIDRSGLPLFCTASKDPSVLYSWRDIAQNVDGPVFGEFDPSGKGNNLYGADVFEQPGWNWTVFVSRPESEVSERVAIIQAATIGVSLATMTVMVLMLVWITRRLLLKPLGKLKRAAELISDNQLVDDIHVHGKDELGELARDMEHMSRSITSYVEKAEVASRAKSNFLAHMSHELRSPLNTIMGYADLVLDEGDMRKLPEETRQYVHNISSSGQHLLDLIGDILDLSKIEADQLSLEEVAFSLPQLLEDLVSSQTLAASERNNKVELIMAEDVHPWIYGDPVRIRQVLMNFISNAIKFTESGLIKLEVIRLSDGPKSMNLHFSIADDGMGIPRSKLESLFDAFTQADVSTTRKFGGTGLGLTINRQLVQAMDGQIGVESEVGRGSTFWFEMEVRKSEELELVANVVEEIKLPPLNILLVEDIKINRMMARKLLENQGHHITEAEDGMEAVRAAQEGRFDVILMDIHMPGMDGIEATRHIRELQDDRQRNIPIIALTADIERSNLREYTHAGMNDTCAKPLNIPTLNSKIAALVDLRNRDVAPEENAPEASPSQPAKAKNGAAVDLDDGGFLLVNLEKFQEIKSMIPDCMSMFQDQSIEVLDRLRDKMQPGDFEKAYVEFHTLKGMAYNMGFDRLAECCAKGERIARRVSDDDVSMQELPALFDRVESLYKETVESLQD